MKSFPPLPWLPRTAAPRLPRRPIPPFHAVPTRRRRDGWTALRQAEFIGHLAETRSVAKAAARVGMSREGAYRLRARRWSESFRAAWDVALGLAATAEPASGRKVTAEELHWRIESGLWRVRMIAGRYAGVTRKADNSALLSLIGRLGARDRPRPVKGAAR